MGTLSITDVFTPATGAQWLSTLLGALTTLGLPVTSWQSGGVARTILAVVSNLQSGEDGLVSAAAQGGFLDFAATGTVTYTGPNGSSITVPVTPDPSIPSQWPIPGTPPAPGWLDFLADSTFNVQRILATNAPGSIVFANTSPQASQAYPIGTYHVANPATGQTYSNTQVFTIAASSLLGGGITNVANVGGTYEITTSAAHTLATGAVIYTTGILGTPGANGFWSVTVVDATHFTLNGSAFSGTYTSGGLVYSTSSGTFQADNQGTIGNAGVGAITQPVVTLVGVFCSNLAPFTGTNVESNALVVNRCRLKIQALSPNGPAGAYNFFALTASQIYQNAIVSGASTQDAMTAAITQALVAFNPSTGIVTTTVANSTGPVLGAAGLQILGASSATPIVLAVASTASLTTGMAASVSGVQGNTAANGLWAITVVDGTHVSLNGSSGNGTYTSGGTLEAGDLGLVDALIQANVVPTGTTAATVSATAQNVTVVATVWFPSAQSGVVVGVVQQAILNYFSTVPIGGFASGVQTPNTLPVEGVEGAIKVAAPYCTDISVTLNGVRADLAISPGAVPVALPFPSPSSVIPHPF